MSKTGAAVRPGGAHHADVDWAAEGHRDRVPGTELAGAPMSPAAARDKTLMSGGSSR